MNDGAGDDDEIVLPWWQHPLNILTLVVTVALIGGMAGYLIGLADDAGPASSAVDVGFLQDMRVHHEQAVEMSFLFLELPDTDPRLRTVARGIIFGQSIELGLMIQMLRDLDAPTEGEEGQAMAWMESHEGMTAAGMPGMASDEDIDRLRTAAGGDADAIFVELMSAHHQGGIDMASEAAERAANEAVRALAASMADGQADEILEMESLLANPR